MGDRNGWRLTEEQITQLNDTPWNKKNIIVDIFKERLCFNVLQEFRAIDDSLWFTKCPMVL